MQRRLLKLVLVAISHAVLFNEIITLHVVVVIVATADFIIFEPPRGKTNKAALVQPGLCQTCSESTMLVFLGGG